MPAIVIISAHGQGNRGDEYNEHLDVWETIPETVRAALEMTDHYPAEPESGEDFSETKWWGELDDDQWQAFRAAWNIEPDGCEQTLGMILGPPYGTLPAVNCSSPGHEWNIGGVYPVDWVDVYLLTDDPDFEEAFS
jgi:hypothetical protein